MQVTETEFYQMFPELAHRGPEGRLSDDERALAWNLLCCSPKCLMLSSPNSVLLGPAPTLGQWQPDCERRKVVPSAQVSVALSDLRWVNLSISCRRGLENGVVTWEVPLGKWYAHACWCVDHTPTS